MSEEDQELWELFGADASEAIRQIEQSLLELESEPANPEEVNRLYRGLHTLKGNAGFLELARIGRAAHVCEDLIGLVRDRGVALDGEMVNLVLEALDILRGAVDFVAREHRDVDESEVAGLIHRAECLFRARAASLDVTSPDIAALDTASPDSSAFLDDPAPPAPELAAPGPGEQARTEDRKNGAPKPTSAGEERSEYLRVDGAKVGMLMDLAGELGLACSAVTRHPGVVRGDLEGFAAAAHKLELLVREIQTDLSSLRLVPVAPVFTRMRRVVRDAGRRTDKKVELVIRGEDTEIDKVMLDALQDPLIHVLRNAVDHGIETADAREAAGKSATGRITLSASYQGGEVTIEIKDDGAGLDRARILARAKARGLCAEHASPSDDEIAQFIFLPGFSTKETIDELSGRGVGMDVVKTTIEGLRGRAHLTSKPGQGSCIRMTMPLTLAFVEAMVVREQDRLFALPIEKVFEVSRVDPSRIVKSTADGRILLRVQDTCVPVLWLHRYWGQKRDSSESLDQRIVVVVQTSRGPLALPVDELIGNQQVMLKPLRGVLSDIRGAAGCGMLRTGDVAIALDCEQLHE